MYYCINVILYLCNVVPMQYCINVMLWLTLLLQRPSTKVLQKASARGSESGLDKWSKGPTLYSGSSGKCSPSNEWIVKSSIFGPQKIWHDRPTKNMYFERSDSAEHFCDHSFGTFREDFGNHFLGGPLSGRTSAATFWRTTFREDFRDHFFGRTTFREDFCDDFSMTFRWLLASRPAEGPAR